MVVNLRCRCPDGTKVELDGLDVSMDLEEFQLVLAEKTGIEPEVQEIRIGYPPKEVELPNDRKSAKLAMLGFANNEVIVLGEKSVQEVQNPLAGARIPDARGEAPVQEAINPLQSFSASTATVPAMSMSEVSADEDYARAIALSLEDPQPGTSRQPCTVGMEDGPIASHEMPDGQFVVRRYVDSDNSCLFTAVGYLMEHNRLKGLDLRSVIADAVMADPLSYTEAVLGKPPHEYCNWILNPQHWGGEIELLILSRYYQRQIAAFDIKSTRCFIYGKDEGYTERVMLLYDGLHYDPLAISPGAQMPEDLDLTIFRPASTDGERIVEGAKNLVAKLNSTMQFTDTQSFTLRCGICLRGFMGQHQAMEHATLTGHTNFQEYK